MSDAIRWCYVEIEHIHLAISEGAGCCEHREILRNKVWINVAFNHFSGFHIKCLLHISRDWATSPIRYISWHPHCFKLAVATVDDTIRIYTDDINNVPVIKSGFQKCITSMAWRPLSAGELAVGCQSGILLWTLDPKSHVIRPLSQVAHFKR